MHTGVKARQTEGKSNTLVLAVVLFSKHAQHGDTDYRGFTHLVGIFFLNNREPVKQAVRQALSFSLPVPESDQTHRWNRSPIPSPPAITREFEALETKPNRNNSPPAKLMQGGKAYQ